MRDFVLTAVILAAAVTVGLIGAHGIGATFNTVFAAALHAGVR